MKPGSLTRLSRRRKRRNRQARKSAQQRSYRRLRIESLEDRRLLTVAASYVNDNWDFIDDADNSGTLTVGDMVQNNNDLINTSSIIAEYGVVGFGTVTSDSSGDSGSFTGSLAGSNEINDAISNTDAGGTVNVLEGTYTESAAIGNGKSVKLLGAGASVTEIAPTTGEYAVVIGLVNGTAESLPGTELSGFTINAAPDPEDMDGLRFNATGTMADPILIRNNVFTGDLDYSKGIETPSYNGIGYAEITDNEFSNLKYGMFANSLSNSLVSRNSVSDIKYSGFAFDTSDVGRLDNVTVSQNTITGAGATGDPAYPAYRVGLRIADTVTNMTITENVISNSAANGIYLAERNGSVTPAAGDIVISGNSVTGSGDYEVVNAITGFAATDASGNWWGSNDESTVVALMSGPVDFTPFLDSGVDTDLGTPGFQGDFSVLNVTTLGAQITGGRIQEGIDLVDVGGTVNVLAGTYDEGPQIVIPKDVDIVGEDRATTIVRPTADTASSGDDRGWFLVNSGVNVDVSNMTFDGNGFKVWQAFRHLGSGTFDNVAFNDIQFNPSTSYAGTAIAAFGASSNVDVTNSFFTNIGRIGVQYFGSGTTGTFSGNTYTGKGAGDHLDYALDIDGANVEVSDNTISGNRGVASSDGSTSAGILITDFFVLGTAVDVHDNTITDDTTGIVVGLVDPINYPVHGADDSSLATIRDNVITGNDTGVFVDGATALLEGNDLTNNADEGLLVSDGAIVDAGQAAGGIDYTGLGISGGGNDFSSYTPAGTAFAIRNENTNPPNDDPGAQGFPYDLSAQNNVFFSAVAADIEQVVYHDADDSSLGFVIYGQTYVMDGMLFVTGTNDDDKIEVKLGSAKNPGKYEVKIKNSSGSFSFKVEDGEEIEKVVVYGLDGNDEIKVDTHGRDVPAWLFGGDGDDKLESDQGDDYLDGGAGNDELKSGDGNDMLFGRDGNDKLESKKGDDKLDGGTGDDRLKSGEGDDKLIGGTGMDKLEGEKGNDILLGGDDDDELKGGEDNDLLIGGDGTDKLDGGKKGDDILIGGWTDYDADCAALDAIMAEWAGGDPVATKVNKLLNGTGVPELSPSTVSDDGNPNKLKGGSGSDWFFAGMNDDLDDFKASDDFLTNV